jgi:hypothetical protein
MEVGLWLVGGILVIAASVVLLLRSRPARPPAARPGPPPETPAWRDRGRNTYVAGHGVLGELTLEAINAGEAGDSGETRRAWLRGAIQRARTTSEASAQLAAEATTPDGRTVTAALANSFTKLADVATTMLDSGSNGHTQRLADAREEVHAALAILRAIT